MNAQKLLSGLSVWFIIALMLAACSGGANEPMNNTEQPANAMQSDEGNTEAGDPIKIEVIKRATQKMPDQDFVKAAIDSKLNTDLVISQEPDDNELSNKLNVRAASSTLPEIMEFSTKNQFQQFADKGLLLDLTPYLEELEEVRSFLGEDAVKKGTYNGHVYAIAKEPSLARFSYWIRKDWLDTLGLPIPETVEELLETAIAFTEQDPDRNGRKDTFGITGASHQVFAPIFGAYGIATPEGGEAPFYVQEGELINALYDPAMADALEMIKSFIAAGVVDPEFASNKQPQANDKAFMGQAGILYHQWVVMRDNEVNQWKTANPEAEWVRIMTLAGPAGSQMGYVDRGATSGYVALPKSLERSPDKLRKVLELLNYVSSEEGLDLVSYGLLDEHYTIESGKPKVMMEKNAEVQFTWVYQIMGRPELEYLTTKFPEQASYIEDGNKLDYIETYNGLLQNPTGYNPADANRFIQEELLKFFYDKAPLSQYASFLETLENVFHYDTFLESSRQQFDELDLQQ
ncbi:extracellular solute-binding protein [Paenibacillus sp. 1P07SE]|uniref:extracellular solute-binding protein n=1 Tax=Paenibacillus sp. 1P07SE TaxID=3132209 RepID=UPI0039A75189